MKIKHCEPDVRTLVDVKPGEVVLHESVYYLCTDTIRANGTIDLVDIESGMVSSLDYNKKVSICKGATMNPLGDYEIEENEC